jgi:hypothetical protein
MLRDRRFEAKKKHRLTLEARALQRHGGPQRGGMFKIGALFGKKDAASSSPPPPSPPPAAGAGAGAGAARSAKPGVKPGAKPGAWARGGAGAGSSQASGGGGGSGARTGIGVEIPDHDMAGLHARAVDLLEKTRKRAVMGSQTVSRPVS